MFEGRRGEGTLRAGGPIARCRPQSSTAARQSSSGSSGGGHLQDAGHLGGRPLGHRVAQVPDAGGAGAGALLPPPAWEAARGAAGLEAVHSEVPVEHARRQDACEHRPGGPGGGHHAPDEPAHGGAATAQRSGGWGCHDRKPLAVAAAGRHARRPACPPRTGGRRAAARCTARAASQARSASHWPAPAPHRLPALPRCGPRPRRRRRTPTCRRGQRRK